jgi:hypothetical protein
MMAMGARAMGVRWGGVMGDGVVDRGGGGDLCEKGGEGEEGQFVLFGRRGGDVGEKMGRNLTLGKSKTGN